MSRPVPRLCLGLLAACLSALLPAASASAALPIYDFSLPSAGRDAPRFATDGAGTTYTAWSEGSPRRIIVGTLRPGTRSITDQTTLGAPADPVDPSAEVDGGPAVATNPAGDVTVVWTTTAGAVVAATRPAGGAFSAPVRASGTSEHALLPQVRMADDGTVLVNWVRSGWKDERGSIRRAGGVFGTPQTLVEGQPADDIAVGPDGTMAVVSVRLEERTDEAAGLPDWAVTEVRRRTPGSTTFGPPAELARSAWWAGATASLGIDASGRVWAHQEGSLDGSAIMLFQAPAGEGFQPACTLYGGPITVTREGDIASTWAFSLGGSAQAIDLTRGLRGAPCNDSVPKIQAAAPVTSGNAARGATVFTDPAGGVHAAWLEATPDGGWFGDLVLRAAYLAPAAPPGGLPRPLTVETLDTHARSLEDVTTDRAGNAIISWESADGPRATIVDHELPVIAAIDVPAELTSGAPLSMGAAAADALSGPPSITWTVAVEGGETATLTGPRVTYQPKQAKPARATITILAQDAAGNAVREVRRVAWVKPQAPAVTLAAPTVKLGAKRFKPAKSRAALDSGKASKSRGATLTVTTKSAATATFSLEQIVTGRRRGAGCSASAKSGKRCTTTRTYGKAITKKLKAGTSTFRLTGRWPKRMLPAGRYRLTITLSSGATKAPPKQLKFAIRR